MRKTLNSLAVAAIMASALAVSATAQAQNTYQLGSVTEFAVGPTQASFQLDTTNGADIRAACMDSIAPVNFVIDFTQVGGKPMFDMVMEAKRTGQMLGVNGKETCIGTEATLADRIVPFG